jgi:hypothetical protein
MPNSAVRGLRSAVTGISEHKSRVRQVSIMLVPVGTPVPELMVSPRSHLLVPWGYALEMRSAVYAGELL